MSSHLLNITCMSCWRFKVNIISGPPLEAKLAHLHPCPWSARAPCVVVFVFPARSLSDSMSLLQACFLPFFFKRLCITIYYVLNSTASSTARNSVFYFVTPFVAGTRFLSFISSWQRSFKTNPTIPSICFTWIHQLWEHFATSDWFLSPCVYYNHDCWIMGNLPTLWPFTPKNFSMYPLRARTFLCKQSNLRNFTMTSYHSPIISVMFLGATVTARHVLSSTLVCLTCNRSSASLWLS